MCLQSIHSKCPAAARVGFIPVLPTADKIQSKCPAAARVGINPTPTWMYAALLHSVGAGFIEAAEKVRQLSQFVCSMLYLCNYGLKIIPEKFGYVTEN